MHVRRLGIIAALAVFALGLAPSGAPAQTFTKPVRIIVPFAPGGTSDILARLIGPKLQDAIGQPVVVENKIGAGGNIGADLVAKAEKDGHTLLLIDVSILTISPNLLASMTYSPSKDLAPIGLVLFAPYVFAVHPSLPVKTIPELVAHAKANAGKVPFGNAGIGVANHISAVQLEKNWGVAPSPTISTPQPVILNAHAPHHSCHIHPLQLQGAQRQPGRRRLLAGTAHDRRNAGADAATPQHRAQQEFSPCRRSPRRSRISAVRSRPARPRISRNWIESNTAGYAAIIKEAGIKVL